MNDKITSVLPALNRMQRAGAERTVMAKRSTMPYVQSNILQKYKYIIIFHHKCGLCRDGRMDMFLKAV